MDDHNANYIHLKRILFPPAVIYIWQESLLARSSPLAQVPSKVLIIISTFYISIIWLPQHLSPLIASAPSFDDVTSTTDNSAATRFIVFTEQGCRLISVELVDPQLQENSLLERLRVNTDFLLVNPL